MPFCFPMVSMDSDTLVRLMKDIEFINCLVLLLPLLSGLVPKLAHEPNGSLKLVNGHSARRSPFVFSEHLLTEKIVVAVDVDEVLGSFLPAVNKFIADRYSLNHSLEDYFVYEFYKIWNCSPTEADIRVHEFFETSYFKMGIHPIPGAKSILQSLSLFCNLYVVTSRQNAIKDQTLEWIEKHYPGLFQEVHFGNYFALDGQSRPKSEICRSLGAQVLIDDNPRFALECAEAGTKVLLFDYDNSYPWCKSGTAASHPQVTIVQNWREVKQHLLSWTKCPENNKYA
ncbi:5'(3')-deoxyribonucleotidase protein [Dioscorea alata]|uniref:5'(3')-deoxyribonucleotidase protein n=1 Tax=Dioscorea alata TaxID=55571 RepID=A0ACB7U4R4_DIOAL|nr:5'(3')-deoxyribonucleotidase protein [Dioscorea alata]